MKRKPFVPPLLSSKRQRLSETEEPTTHSKPISSSTPSTTKSVAAAQKKKLIAFVPAHVMIIGDQKEQSHISTTQATALGYEACAETTDSPKSNRYFTVLISPSHKKKRTWRDAVAIVTPMNNNNTTSKIVVRHEDSKNKSVFAEEYVKNEDVAQFSEEGFEKEVGKYIVQFVKEIQEEYFTMSRRNRQDENEVKVAQFAAKVSKDNIGYKMLSKMGWKQGQVIGREGRNASTEPVQVRIKYGSTGLGFFSKPEET